MKKVLIVFIFLMCVMSLKAQQFFTDSVATQVTTVNGLNIWGEYDYNQVVAALGIPQSYTDEISTDDESAGVRFQEYVYSSGSRFSFANRRFINFSIRSANDSAFINGAIGVGDPISKIFEVLDFGSGDFFYESSSSNGTLGTCMYLKLPDTGGNYFRFYYKTGFIISSIHFSTEE